MFKRADFNSIDKQIENISLQLKTGLNDILKEYLGTGYIVQPGNSLKTAILKAAEENFDINNHIKVHITATTEQRKNKQFTVMYQPLDELGQRLLDDMRSNK